MYVINILLLTFLLLSLCDTFKVLHLMNRMNLPPPFEELEAEFPMLKEIYDIEKYKDILGKDILESVKGK